MYKNTVYKLAQDKLNNLYKLVTIGSKRDCGGALYRGTRQDATGKMHIIGITDSRGKTGEESNHSLVVTEEVKGNDDTVTLYSYERD